MASDGEPGGRRPFGERVLIWLAAIGAVILLAVSAGLWLRFGETVYAARVISLLQNCL